MLRGTLTEPVSARPEAVFELISSVHRLPEWNERIHHVVDAPEREAREGDEWVVEVRALGSRWNSRSQLQEVDREAMRLSLRSQTDDGNPSYGLWTWEIAPAGEGSQVTVRWELHPATFWRKTLLARIRHRQLKDEVQASLHAVERVLTGAKP